MNDPFAVPVAQIATPSIVPLSREFEPDLFLDGDRFMEYLGKTYEAFDVATYSRSKALGRGQPLPRVERLIYGLRLNAVVTTSKQKKHILNNHVKLFICYKAGVAVDAYVGSQNLTYGTNLNLMYRVRPEHVKPLLDFFNLLWKSTTYGS